ncbi:steroidogenic acute regulatory protein, mitochondrial [Macrosteles quadrilineatus]|uniref:steroidogenic acute regulatory protein, mitochondrial n=1 Tax=Macrosteles quadrilineatus TaxID=74068 RepID=UPI0023E1ED58|nr:steroidogenic acute regulatory protein, mitochondrial [Macrosteles quadrilineatus]
MLLGLVTGMVGLRYLPRRSKEAGNTTVGGTVGVSSTDGNFLPLSSTDVATVNFTEHVTDEPNRNSSIFQENNDTEVSLVLDESNRNYSMSTNLTEDDLDYDKMGQEMLTEATTILDTGIWDFERRTEDGDAIFSRQLDNGNMVYRLTGIVDMPPQDLLVIIWDGLPDYPKWNPSLLECRVLEKINDQTDISYTVSAPGARGYVASRDFVSLRHWELRHNTYIAASKSIDFSRAPSNPEYIRGKNGPGCMELRPLSSDPSKTEFRWLLNTKLNGWIPSYIADKAYKKFMTKYMIFLREYCKIIKQRTTDFTISTTTTKNITV